MKKRKAKKLVQGVDWFGWGWRFPNGELAITQYQPFPIRPPRPNGWGRGRWVRVNLVEVEPKKARSRK